MNRFTFSCLVLFLFFTSPALCQTHDNTQVRGLVKENAMVVSANILASEIGRDILLQGGNAFDAAVATHFALAVVYPQAGNIGGGGFAVYLSNTASGPEIGSLDFREKAPLSASKDMYLDEQKNVIPKLSLEGHLAVGVPGSVDGMFKLHEKYGTMDMKELIQPSINLAYHGFEINESLAFQLNRFEDTFKKVNKRNTTLNKETAWKKGDLLINKALASTLAIIRDQGRNGFYEGIVAEQIVKESQKGNGMITAEDLSIYSSKWRKPVTGMYKGHQVVSMPPPSSGGIALLQLLQGADHQDLKVTGHNSAETIHKMIEVERRVYADRATFLGDQDFITVPTATLLDTGYNNKRFASINPRKATPSSVIKEGKVDVIESFETTHYSVVDKDGNAVSITTTLNSYFGSKVEVEGAGFFLNNEMDDFSSKPGIPNQFGLVGNEANAIAPEKRMLSSMTPTIVMKDDKIKMVVGTPGGSTIITSVYQAIVNVIDHELTMQEAVNAPKFHHQWLPDQVFFEQDKFDEKT